MTLGEIQQELDEIQSVLECLNDANDINAMLGRLDQLGVYYARSGALLAEIIGMRDAAVMQFFKENADLIVTMSPSLANKMVNSAAGKFNSAEKRADRVNAACKHQCDNLRTMISFEKERLKV